MLDNKQKAEIAQQIKAFQQRTGKSGNEMGKSIPGISNATISNMLNHKWDSIKDDKWRLIANYIRFDIPAETTVFKKVSSLLWMCQQYKVVKVFLSKPGSGKTYTSIYYTNKNREVYYLSCGHWSRNQFLERLLNAFGRDTSDLKVTERSERLKELITEKNNPLIIIDEVDKLQDNALLLLVELYNYIWGFAGMFLCATEAFEKKITKQVRKQKVGFEELLSRFGGSFEKWETDSSQEEEDMTSICRLRGITDEEDIFNIIQKSKNTVHKYDMRILEDRIREHKLRNELLTINN